ncbi:MAG: YbfB/YjiJ family MFS transporter [Hoeflea sp.]|uniref:YbfB/YjiJ family MFS transporter n=1 Tax=Hoeflea sp. TaxID=1940281 RepID=UPI001D4E9FAA|nr:YbfB/YjiJ family MFS transporter [Hoeflea sp.]MBU4527670.1 YbfB/YjiJ family MFS transporter [Alphaproteobacteria bacterium]MBU4546462.1 YbfB/YjiJ family MFS transporter [Alphaproteobacteria bacterium]MBU4553020.1 YbfB/YjiJ family MFS transporter [Alphaproteobacteria bacterium]MBV1724092.1 YbfB/YjiJ family MFS transporter [Hoeflea sp.]MBV1759777.1 YbfB/YjiJ family MFS transporter [Hoeflea sp.]
MSQQFRSLAPSADPNVVRTALAGAVAMAVAMGLGRFFYTPVLPAMMADLGLGPAEAGWIASANYVGYLLGAILAAYGWAEGIERKVALASLVATAALLLAMGLSSDVAVLAAIRFLAGLASAFAMIFTTAIVLSHGLVSGKSWVQATHFGGVGAGIAISAIMFGLLVLADGGWRMAWIAAAALAFAGLAVVMRHLPQDVARSGPAKKEPPLVWTGPLLGLTVAYGIFGFGYIVTATFLVAIVRDGGGSSLFEAGVWLVTGLAAAPSVAYWLPAVRRLGLVNVFALGCLVEALGVAASVLVPLPAGPVIGGLLLGATFIMVTAFGLQAGRQLAGDSPRRALALMTAAFGTGQIIGPVVAGYLADWTGTYTWASLAAAAALLASGAIALAFCRTRPGAT